MHHFSGDEQEDDEYESENSLSRSLTSMDWLQRLNADYVTKSTRSNDNHEKTKILTNENHERTKISTK